MVVTCPTVFHRLPVSSPGRQTPARLKFTPSSREPLAERPSAEPGGQGVGLCSLGKVPNPRGICALTLEITTEPALREARRCRPTFTKSSISGSLSSPLAVAESVIPSAPRAAVPGRRGATSAALQAPTHGESLSSERCLIFFLRLPISHQFLQARTAMSERSASQVTQGKNRLQEPAGG